jgi:hypothetical protein
VPIFGSGAAIFPQAVLDRFAKAKQDAEIDYLNELGGVSLEQFQLSSTLKNPWHNQAFNAKYQSSLDMWLDVSAAKFGGNYQEGMLALQGNREFLTMAKSYEEYAAIYNAVFDDAVAILSHDPEQTYVSDTTYQSAQKFVHDYENLDDLPIDELVRRARTYKTHISIAKIADMAMADIGTRVYEGFEEAKAMGTDEVNVYLKKTRKGPSQEELDAIYQAQVKARPSLFKNDPTAQALGKTEIRRRAER